MRRHAPGSGAAHERDEPARAGRSSGHGQRRWTRRTRREHHHRAARSSRPGCVGFLGFYLYPALASLYYSFTDFRILQAPEWIGLQNYQRMVNDPLFWKALGNTIWLVLVMVPISVGVALGDRAAPERPGHLRHVDLPDDLLPAGRRARGRQRRAVDLAAEPEVRAGQRRPWASSGSTGPQWFYDADWAKPGLVLMAVWAVGDVIIIYLGALQGVPRDLYDAAEVDGAGIRASSAT